MSSNDLNVTAAFLIGVGVASGSAYILWKLKLLDGHVTYLESYTKSTLKDIEREINSIPHGVIN